MMQTTTDNPVISAKPPDDTLDSTRDYEDYVHRAITAGIADAKAGLGTSIDEVRRSFGLTE